VLDLKRIRKEPDVVKASLGRRGEEWAPAVQEVLEKDQHWRDLTTNAESLRAMQRSHSDNIAAGKKAGADVEPELAKMKEMSTQVKDLVEQARIAEEQLGAALARLPNLPDPSAAPGPEDELVRTVGEPRAFEFEARDHLELAGTRIDM